MRNANECQKSRFLGIVNIFPLHIYIYVTSSRSLNSSIIKLWKFLLFSHQHKQVPYLSKKYKKKVSILSHKQEIKKVQKNNYFHDKLMSRNDGEKIKIEIYYL